MKKESLIVWAFMGILLVLGTFWWGVRNLVTCWDGIEVDEALLIEQCGITKQEYLSGDYLDSTAFCLEESGAVEFVGGCDPAWSLVTGFTVAMGIAYVVISAVYVAIQKLINRGN